MRAITSKQSFQDVERLLNNLGKLPEPVNKPVLIVLSGIPGTGKSYFSRCLAESISLVILENDALWKTLFSKPTYSVEESKRLFYVCYLLIYKILERGISIIFNATNLFENTVVYSMILLIKPGQNTY